MGSSEAGKTGCLGRLFQLIGALLVLLLFTTEVVVRFLPLPGLSRADLIVPANDMLAKARTIGHPYLGYSLKPEWSVEASSDLEPYTKGYRGQKSQNADGFRNPAPPLKKPPGTFRIVTMGGSSTYGNTPTSDATTWPAQLEVMLNQVQDRPVEVLNAGVVGWNSYESLINLSLRVVDYEPDLVLVYHTINDTRCILWKPGGEWRRDNTHYREIWPTERDAYTSEPLLERSYTYLLWRRFFTGYLTKRTALDFFAMKGYDPSNMDPYERGEIEQRGIDAFRRNIVSIAGVAQAHGSKVMLATQACDRSDIMAKSHPNQWAVMDTLGEILKDVAQQGGLEFCDARTQLEAHAAKVGKDLIFTGEVHLRDEGAAKLAQIFAGAITQSGVLEE